MLWETSGEVTVAAVQQVLELPRKTVWNINIPNERTDSLRGVRWGRIAAFGTTKTSLEEARPGVLRIKVTPRDVELSPDTDTALVDAGYVSITGLIGFRTDGLETPNIVTSLEESILS